MDKQNEKLLEFAGFTWHKQREYVHGYMMHGGSWVEGHWDYKGQCSYELLNGEQGRYGRCVLDFPNDLNACFKWLVPEIKKYIKFESISFSYGALIACHIKYYPRNSGLLDSYFAVGESESLALCQAVLKLIGDK